MQDLLLVGPALQLSDLGAELGTASLGLDLAIRGDVMYVFFVRFPSAKAKTKTRCA